MEMIKNSFKVQKNKSGVLCKVYVKFLIFELMQ